jgi:addiction module RelE/StbE family toxin
MKLRWTHEAASDLERIAGFLFATMPQHAEGLVRRIYNAPAALLQFPRLGRPGRKPGTRELVLSPLPYILVYQLDEDTITLARILHGAQSWP